MLADGTDGELITWDAAGGADTVAVGTADQVLTSNGVGTAPTFKDPAGGGGSGGFQIFSNSFQLDTGVFKFGPITGSGCYHSSLTTGLQTRMHKAGTLSTLYTYSTLGNVDTIVYKNGSQVINMPRIGATNPRFDIITTVHYNEGDTGRISASNADPTDQQVTVSCLYTFD